MYPASHWFLGHWDPSGDRADLPDFFLPFSASNKLNLKLTSVDTSANHNSIYADAVLFALIPFPLILGSYGKIILTILKLSPATGTHKLFSTCSSYFIVVILFFGSGLIVYFRPKSNHSEGFVWVETSRVYYRCFQTGPS